MPLLSDQKSYAAQTSLKNVGWFNLGVKALLEDGTSVPRSDLWKQMKTDEICPVIKSEEKKQTELNEKLSLMTKEQREKYEYEKLR
jgi:hypothetical protein